MLRIKIIKYFYFLFILLIILRLGYWQIIRADYLTAKGENQRLNEREVLASRGSILFSDQSTLASSQPMFLIYAQPKVVKDKEGASSKLAGVIFDLKFKDETLDEESKFKELDKLKKDFLDKLSKDLYWVSLGYKVDVYIKDQVEKFNIEGIGFEESSARFYPEGSSSAHLLGFVGSDIYGSDTGYFGLEGYYNGELKGKSGLFRTERDALGLPILIGNFLSREPKVGKTLSLNINRTIQFIVEEKLKKGVEKYGAKGASAIVMDPKTGNILAMASLPSYDPQNPSGYPREFFKNPPIADSYEPGSTFKVLVMAAAINEKVIKEDTKCDNCGGPIRLGGFDIRTWNNKYTDGINMTETIIHSNNIGMVFVSKKLGKEKLLSYIERFGFGKSTNVDLQDEDSPSLRSKSEWKEIDVATASFGQGIAVSALQMVKAVGVIANGGKLMEPHVVKAITDEGKSIDIKPKELGKPITKETAKVITNMMVRAVNEGEAKFVKPDGYKIAGKTGTAQIPVSGHYDPNKTIASFIGFAPADDPKFIMLVRYTEPSSSVFGSETAAPTFFDIAKELFLYYGIPPHE
ncbi:penicillin-binding protein 2 [Candidatus Daviesbacteria bacterium]|nr:penicillin-binding protein 2 [Candidatus Daviesbacteria bacterium]